LTEYLVHIRNEWPIDGDPARKAELNAAESARAAELAEAGVLQRLWRVAGRRENVGIWSAADGTELHAALSSLPLFPWLDIDVQPLADHQNDPARTMEKN
jgi:muconolactone D-isomerase